MSFTSYPFLWFFAGFVIAYCFCPARYRRYVLLAGGLAFCAIGSVWGAVCVLCFTAVNYGLGGLIGMSRHPRPLTIAAVVMNVISLALFKASGRAPVGISFYVLAMLAYLIDIGRGTLAPEQNLLHYAGATTFFPIYAMGPIVRYGELAPKLERSGFHPANIQPAFEQFTLGFAVKVLLADRLTALWQLMGRAGYGRVSWLLAWYGLFAYGLSVYLQWRGYTLMAGGLARLVGVELPTNFGYPYLARSVREFFHHWHITLRKWILDYLYIPLGGDRGGKGRTAVNVLLVCALVGLWHGLRWTALIWGLLVGGFIVLDKLVLEKKLARFRILPHLYVLLAIHLCWLFFAFPTLPQVFRFLPRLIPFLVKQETVRLGLKQVLGSTIAPLLGGILFLFPLPENLVRRFGRTWVGSAVLAVLFWASVVVLVLVSGSTGFVYLNF